MATSKVSVSKRALLQRINRVLKKDDEVVRASRGARAKQDLGDFYAINLRRNFLADSNVDLEKLGRKLDVLKPWENLGE